VEAQIPELQKNPNRHLVLLMDFDGYAADRRAEFEERMAAVRGQVFLLGSAYNPEKLKTALGKTFETVGCEVGRACARASAPVVRAVSSPPLAVPGGRAAPVVRAVSSPPLAVPGGRAAPVVRAVSSPPLAVPGGRAAAPASTLWDHEHLQNNRAELERLAVVRPILFDEAQ
jgi:hypothetical protein